MCDLGRGWNIYARKGGRLSSLHARRIPTGTQFIPGACTSDADCASGCCNAKTALCAPRLVALEGAGCGFGSSPAGVGAAAPAAATPAAAPAPAADGAPAKAPGTQFIMGACTSDADCASGCYGKKSGLCAARAVALEGARTTWDYAASVGEGRSRG
ncbi:hypothetical protein FB451DRAFT_1519671 [Mycena latifolia]|nr:hypothetical protein FB451DRAFT_1519671 [Mycena latifolia]